MTSPSNWPSNLIDGAGGVSRAPLFELEGVKYRYAEADALNGVCFPICPGQRLALVGANGSGKSTLLRILDALLFPASGSVRFRGQTLTEDRFAEDDFAYSFRKQVGFVFQNSDAQLFCATAFEEVAFGLLQLQLPQSEVADRVHHALESLDIGHLARRPPHRLSGGEKKKVALASVLVLEPDVLLLDEPTAGLDPRSQTHLIEILDGWKDPVKTIVTATHDLHMLEDLADTCAVLEQGRLIASAPPAQILEDRGLLERANLIHAHRHSRAPHSHSHLGLHRETEK
jgi:cobalt/nickel transport system ATP-binding protein